MTTADTTAPAPAPAPAPATAPRLRRRLLVLAATAAVALSPCAGTAVADPAGPSGAPTTSTAASPDGAVDDAPQGAPAVAAAQPYDGAQQLTSVKPVADYCATHANECRFVIDRAASSQYLTAVRSLGNVIVNCTKDPIKVTRQVSLQVTDSDNLGGEITGQLTVEGQLSGSAAVTAGVAGEAGGNFKTPDQSKGPSAEVNAKGSANGSGTLTGSASLRAAFQGAFRLFYNKAWTTQQTETTTYDTAVDPGDALTFGASTAMQRVAGGIFAGKLGIRNVFVDGPSSVNSSTFVAETYTVPGDTCLRVRPPRPTGTDNTTPPGTGGTPPGPGADRALPTARPDGLTVLPGGLPLGSRLKHRTVLSGGRG